MSTRYIINNLSGQTITGNLTVSGNLNVTGTSISNNLATYKALITQTDTITGTTLGNFQGGLIIGETYTINNYLAGDDFSNIANVTSGIINTTGCVFIATGETPTNYNNGSELISSGNLAVTVLENTLGYDIDWIFNVFGPGTYLGLKNENGVVGPYYNDFPRNNTFMKVGTPTYIYGPNELEMFAGVGSVLSKDEFVFIGVFDESLFNSVNNYLYYLPVEINSKQDTDTTPIVISGTVQAAIPFSYVTVNLFCNGNFIENFVGDNTEVTNLPELLAQLNTNQATSYLGTYSDAGDGGLLLTIPTNKANQFCSSGILSFTVSSD